MAQQIGESTKVTLDLKTIGIIIGGAISLATMYFTLKSDIAPVSYTHLRAHET